jgi:hypothetical protein
MNAETTPHRLYNARGKSEDSTAAIAQRESDRAVFSRICAELHSELTADPVAREAFLRVLDRRDARRQAGEESAHKIVDGKETTP